MALIGNGVRMGGGPHLAMSNAGIQSVERARWTLPGSLRCFYAGQATVIAGSGIASKGAFPNGYLPPYTWVMPPKPGGMSSYQLLTGTASVSAANLAGGLNAESPMTGAGTLTADIVGIGVIASSPTGTGTFTADISALGNIASSQTGTGTLTADIVGIGVIASDLSGTWIIDSASVSLVVGMTAALSGTWVINLADCSVLVPMDAALTGTGSLTATILGAGVIVSAQTGTWTITAAALGAEVSATAALTGTGTLTAGVTATGGISADIEANFSATVTTEEMADAVWAHLIHAGFDAERVLKIIAAATAGKSSGGPGSPVFRDLADSEDMVSGTADSSGNRSGITYGG